MPQVNPTPPPLPPVMEQPVASPPPLSAKAPPKAPPKPRAKKVAPRPKMGQAEPTRKQYRAVRYRKVDPDTGTVFPAQAAVVVANVRPGSWLASQIAAGVIIEV